MGGVRLTRHELEQRFALSSRLVVRVGALLAKHTDISAAVLELARAGTDVERVLLAPQVLAQAGSLTARQLSQIAEKIGAEPESPLAVQAEGGWRTIVLEEELLAEKGWQTAAPTTSRLPARRKPTDVTLETPIAERLFTPEEIERLKVEALTAADPAQKAASLRRLSLAPISEQEKAAVFFKVLVDPVAQGRTEAISGLQALGFDADAAGALRDLLEGKEQTRTLAVERITGLLGRLGQAHGVIVAGVILEILQETDEADLQERLLAALREAAPLLAKKPDFGQDAVRLALRAMQINFNRLASPARQVLLGLGALDAHGVVNSLWQELERVRNHRARIFILSVLAQIGPPARLRKAVAAAMASEIVEPGAPEADRLMLGHSLVAMGDDAIGPLATAMEAKHREQKPLLVPFLDILCQSKATSAAARNQIGRAALASLKVEERRTRLAIVQAALCSHPDMEASLRRDLAQELINNLDAFDHPDVRERIEVNLERIGEPAVEPLFDFVKRHPLGTHRDQRKNFTDHLVRILAVILAQESQAARSVHPRLYDVVDFCVEQIKDDRVKFGGYAEAAAMLCAPEAGGVERGEALVALLLERLRNAAYPGEILAALGIAGAARQISLKQKIEVAHTFLKVIGAKRTAPVAEARQTPEGVIYEFGKDADLDSVMLPAAVAGAGQICISETTTPALRQMIIEHLLGSWRQATSWRVTWGPLSTEKLAATLGMLGSHARIPVEVRLQIAHALKEQAGSRLSVVRAMGEICSQPVKLKDLDAIGLDVAAAIMEGWLGAEIEPEERRVVMTTLARIAARNEMDRRSPRVRKLREQVLERVFDAFRDRFDGARALLEILHGCRALTKQQRKEIEERLRSYTALEKVA